MELVRTFVVNDWELKTAFNEPVNNDTSEKKVNTLNIPGAGKFRVKSLTLASDKIHSGESLKLSVQISGENIAYLTTEIYLKDKEGDYYYGPVTQEYVRSSVEKEVNGVVHPTWDSEINLSLEIKPVLRLITDGINAAFAFMHPVGYGRDETLLEGLFTKKGSGNSNRAHLIFNQSGQLIDKHIIQEKRGRLVTHDLTIKSGDMFIAAVHVLTALNLDDPQAHFLHGITGTLTKLEDSFHWVDEAAFPGEYLLGLVVEDFNGDKFRYYVPFTIEKE